jgi:hypothetical protein
MAAGFGDFHEFASHHDILGHLWREYSETLVLPSPGDARIVIRNSDHAGSYFNLSTIVEGRINLRVYREVSNYLPGFGILGTFVGLTAGIFLAQGGLTTDDPGRMRESLRQLLNGASLAFWTSIIGLVCSLIYSPREKAWTHKLQKAIEEFCEALDARMERVTLEQVAADQLRELKDQTTQLQRFNTDLAVSISSALDERLAGRFAPLLDRTLAALEGIRTDSKQSDEEMIQRLASQFHQTFTGAAGSEMDALGRNLQDISIQLQGAASSLTGAGAAAGDEIRNALAAMARTSAEHRSESDGATQRAIALVDDQLRRMADAMQASAGAAGDGLRQAALGAGENLREAASAMGTATTGAIEGMQASASSFALAVDKLSGTLQEAQELANLSRTAFRELQGSLVALQAGQNAIRDAAEPLKLSSQALTSQLHQQATLLDQLKSLDQQMHLTAQSVERSGGQLTEAWDRIHSRFEGIDGSLNGVFKEIDQGVQVYTNRVTEFVQKLDEHLAQATSILSGAIQDLQDAVEDLSEKR